MASIGVFTIASKNYLAYVRTLFNSVLGIHPEYKLFLCLADRVDGYFDPSKEPYEVIEAEQIGIPWFQDMTLRYDIMEFNTAVKPFMFRWLFENTDLDSIIYLDPDIRVYSRFDRLEAMLDAGASVILTPHITKPLEDDKIPNDYHMLQAGVFNLGFIAAHRCEEALHFIGWWGRRLTTQCAADFPNNLFTDQKWCDLAPCFLDDLNVLKDSGYNVAYWNLAQRRITSRQQRDWQVEGVPLVFFHFSGVNVNNRHLVSKHQNRFSWGDIEGFQGLFTEYLDELIAYGWNETSHWPYVYNLESRSFVINALMRRLYRLANPQPVEIHKEAVEGYLMGLCNQAAEGNSCDGNGRITRLMNLVYQLRPDIQEAFNLSTPHGRQQFIDWFEIAGEKEYGLPPVVVRQNCILGTSSLPQYSIRTLPVQRYGALLALEAQARNLAVYLPAGLRMRGKRIWFFMRALILNEFGTKARRRKLQ